MLNKRLFLSNLSDETVFSGYVLSSEWTGTNTVFDGYEKDKNGEVSSGIDFFSAFYTYTFSGTPGEIYWAAYLWDGKPDIDGGVAHAYQCDFKSDIFSGILFLVPTWELVNVSDTVSLFKYPGKYYVMVEDLPNRIFVDAKSDVELDEKISFPCKIEKNVSRISTPHFMKDEKYLNYTSGYMLEDYLSPEKVLVNGEKCNISMRITPLSGGGVFN